MNHILGIIYSGSLFCRMSVTDFTKNFESLDICCLCPDFLDRSPGYHWKSQRSSGKWVAGTTAGGSMDNIGVHVYNINYLWYMLLTKHYVQMLVSVMTLLVFMDLCKKLFSPSHSVFVQISLSAISNLLRHNYD